MRDIENYSITSLLCKTLKRVEYARNYEDGVNGIQSGYGKIDRLTLGWQVGELIIIASRPSMGKTALAISMARNASVDFNKNVLYFSNAMSNIEMSNRLIANESEIALDKIRKGRLEEHEFQNLKSNTIRFEKAPLFIDDTPFHSVDELYIKAFEFKGKHGLDMVIIDDLQLLNSGNRNGTIESICIKLKHMAVSLNIPVIVLSGLSGELEKRKKWNKRPILSDLEDMGISKKLFDVVIFLFRPEYYMLEPKSWEMPHGYIELIFARNSNGAIENIALCFINRYMKFNEIEVWNNFVSYTSSWVNPDYQFINIGLNNPSNMKIEELISHFETEYALIRDKFEIIEYEKEVFCSSVYIFYGQDGLVWSVSRNQWNSDEMKRDNKIENTKTDNGNHKNEYFAKMSSAKIIQIKTIDFTNDWHWNSSVYDFLKSVLRPFPDYIL